MSKDLTTWKELAQMKVANHQPARPASPMKLSLPEVSRKMERSFQSQSFLPAQEGLVTTPPVSSHISYFPEGIHIITTKDYTHRVTTTSFNLGVSP